jgi:hypothetical protein
MPTRAETDRLRALIEMGIAINAELSRGGRRVRLEIEPDAEASFVA